MLPFCLINGINTSMLVYNIYVGDAYILGSQVVSSAIIDKYIGESARLIREMFNYARDQEVRAWLFEPFQLEFFVQKHTFFF